jgi:glycosyltransferase
MEKIKLHIFVQDHYRGASYGIGTYINQLIDWADSGNAIDLTLIHLYSSEKQLKIEERGSYKQFFIPALKKPQGITADTFEERSIRSAVYLLKEIIPEDRANIFHFQFMDQYKLINRLKNMFSGKVILTVHYTGWSFNLLGDEKRLKHIMCQPVGLLSYTDKMIVSCIEQDKRIIRLCDRIVCIAYHSYNSIKKTTGIDGSKICIIPNGIKDDYRSISEKKKSLLRKKYQIADSQKNILFAGRLDEIKGIDYLIKSFEKLLVFHPEAHLVLIGDGNFNKWFSLINNCWTKITFTGRQNKKQLYDWYKIADIGVSCPIHEEFGMVAIEMMMYRLPLIVTDTGGLAEIIEDQITGLKVPLKRVKGKPGVDVNTLAKQIRFLLDNPGIASLMGKNARKKFLEKYQLLHFKNNMLNLYNNVVNENANT